MEWGTLVSNLNQGYGYSFYSVDVDGNLTVRSLKTPLLTIPSAYMPPLYAFFLFLSTKVFGNNSHTVLIVEFIQAILGGFLCYIVYKIALQKFSKKAAIIAASIIAVYPIWVYSSTQISSVNIYLPLGYLIFLLLTIYERTGKLSPLISCAFLSGLMILTRAEFALFIPFIAIWLAYIHGRNLKRKVAAACLFVGLCTITVSPWIWRNYEVFGEVTPPTLSGGYNLWRGNNSASNGAGIYGDPIPDSLKTKIQNIPYDNKYELRKDDIFKHEAVNYIVSNPLSFIGRSINKFAFYWGNYYWDADKSNYKGVNSPLIIFPWLIIVALSIVSMVKRRDRIGKFSLFFLWIVLSTVIVMIFFVLPRYNLFLLPLLVIFSADGLLILLEYINTITHNQRMI